MSATKRRSSTEERDSAEKRNSAERRGLAKKELSGVKVIGKKGARKVAQLRAGTQPRVKRVERGGMHAKELHERQH